MDRPIEPTTDPGPIAHLVQPSLHPHATQTQLIDRSFVRMSQLSRNVSSLTTMPLSLVAGKRLDHLHPPMQAYNNSAQQRNQPHTCTPPDHHPTLHPNSVHPPP